MNEYRNEGTALCGNHYHIICYPGFNFLNKQLFHFPFTWFELPMVLFFPEQRKVFGRCKRISTIMSEQAHAKGVKIGGYYLVPAGSADLHNRQGHFDHIIKIKKPAVETAGVRFPFSFHR